MNKVIDNKVPVDFLWLNFTTKICKQVMKNAMLASGLEIVFGGNVLM